MGIVLVMNAEYQILPLTMSETYGIKITKVAYIANWTRRSLNKFLSCKEEPNYESVVCLIVQFHQC